MSSDQQDGLEASNVHVFPSEPHAAFIRADLRSLRLRVTSAWQERAVMLTPDEQQDLRAEIHDLCQYLKALTGHRE